MSFGTRLVVGVSGGPDSMALLDVMRRLKGEVNLDFVAVHVNHGLRREAKADQKLVEDYCRAHNLPLIIKTVDVKSSLGKNGGGLEERARELRYQALKSVGGYVVTAHTLDDQVETVLFNFLRGAGMRGMAGMRDFVRGILRPFLGVPKVDILAYVEKHKVPYRVDKTNLDKKFTRNRIRHELLPTLREYNPKIDEQVIKISTMFDQANTAIQELARLYVNSFSEVEEHRAEISLSRFKELTPLMQGEVVKLVLDRLGGSLNDFEATHFQEVRRLVSTSQPQASKRVKSKLLLEKRYDKIMISLI